MNFSESIARAMRDVNVAFSQPTSFTTRGSSNSSTPEPDATNLSGRQREALVSFRKVIQKIRKENGNSVEIFRNEDQLYETCADLEDREYRTGRDLLLTIFMKQIPQVFANIYIANNRVYWDADTEETLTDELGMNQEFALNVLKILKEEFEK